MPCARIIMADVWNRIDVAATIDGRLHMRALAETPVALDHRIGCIEAVNDDGYADTARNHDFKAAAGKSRRRRRHQDCQCHANAHCPEPRSSKPNLIEGPHPRVKAPGQTAGKPNAQASAAVQLRA